MTVSDFMGLGAAVAQAQEEFQFSCHLCGKVKSASTEWRALYELAFHYDRRHKGWTHEGASA